MLDALQFSAACFFAIFPIVNPFSASALLVALTPGEPTASRARQSGRAVAFMTVALLASYFAGSYVLRFFAVTQPALIMAAGTLVCRSGWRALTGAERLTADQREEGLHKTDISLTPLGMPMLAGPGTISVVIGLSASSPNLLHDGGAVAAILVVAVLSYAVLRGAPAVVHFLGRTGEAAISKVMGLLILCVGIQFIINAVAMIAPSLVVRPL